MPSGQLISALEQLEQHFLDQPLVRTSLADDLFLRSFNWTRWQLSIPLPAD